MIIETISNPECEEIKFEDLEPGIVFEFEGAKALKLEGGKYIMLTYTIDEDWFEIGDGSMLKYRKITKVWGKLIGLKVQ